METKRLSFTTNVIGYWYVHGFLYQQQLYRGHITFNLGYKNIFLLIVFIVIINCNSRSKAWNINVFVEPLLGLTCSLIDLQYTYIYATRNGRCLRVRYLSMYVFV